MPLLHSSVAVTIFALQEEWLSVEIRICPASLLNHVRQVHAVNHVRQVHAPHIFTPNFPTRSAESWATLSDRIEDIVEDIGDHQNSL